MKGPTKKGQTFYNETTEHKWMVENMTNGVHVMDHEIGMGQVIFPFVSKTVGKKSAKTINFVQVPTYEDTEGKIIRRPKYVTTMMKLKCPHCHKRVSQKVTHYRTWPQMETDWTLVTELMEAFKKLLSETTGQREESIKQDEVAVKDEQSIRLDELKRKFGRIL